MRRPTSTKIETIGVWKMVRLVIAIKQPWLSVIQVILVR